MFSILMAVYHKESPVFFREALKSLCDQTVAPAEVLIVHDGKLTSDLYAVLNDFHACLPLKELRLPHNVGLAKALNAGLKHIKTEWVMRFDSDDVCDPHRIEIQSVTAMSNAFDIFGCMIHEFNNNVGDTQSIRTVPLGDPELRTFAIRRNPLNHMTVCFKKSVIEQLNGYPTDIPLMEDYALWLKAIASGYRIGNTNDILVHARVGAGMFQRRGGWIYLKSEVRLQRLMIDLGLKNRLNGITTGLTRGLAFALPPKFKRHIYMHFLRR